MDSCIVFYPIAMQEVWFRNFPIIFIIFIVIIRTGSHITKYNSNVTPTHLKHEELLYVDSEHFVSILRFIIDRSKYSNRTFACFFGKSVNISRTAMEQFQKKQNILLTYDNLCKDLYSKWMNT